MGAFSKNDRIAFKFNSSLFFLSDYCSECLLCPGVSYAPAYTVGYQHLVTQRGNTPASPGGDKAPKAGDSAYSGDDVCTVMAFSGIEDPQDCQVIWTIFTEKKKNVDACRRYLMKGMTDYVYNRRILIDGGIYLEQVTMKAILELRFNPGEGMAYVQSAAKGLSLLCCRSRANNETEEIKERELALKATEQTRQFEDYVKYVKGTVVRQPVSNYWDLKQNIATYMALLWVLFGDRCDYFINLNKIHAVMDLPEVQQLRQKFSAEICRRISWAIIDNGRSFFNTVLTQQDFDGNGALSFPQSFLAGVLENVRFCNPIQRGNFPTEWMALHRTDRLRQPACGMDTQTPAGGGSGGARGGGTPGGGGFGRPAGGGGGSQQKRENDGDGGPRIGGPGGRGWKRWSPPSPDPRHPKIAAMMNPYLEMSNGVLSLSRILDAGKITMNDLPGLDKYKDPTTGRHIFCWAEVLGPCHYPECYFGKKGGHPQRADYSDKFADQVVQTLGPGVAARMAEMRASDGKRVKMEPGATNA